MVLQSRNFTTPFFHFTAIAISLFNNSGLKYATLFLFLLIKYSQKYMVLRGAVHHPAIG